MTTSRLNRATTGGLLASCVVTSVALAGCTNTVSLTPGPRGTSPYCTGIESSAPVSVANQLIRETSPQDSGVLAWGDPVITLTCGVMRPKSLEATSQLVSVNGVDWYPEKLTRGQRFTSVNTPEYVQVDIPEFYESASGVLVDLATALLTN